MVAKTIIEKSVLSQRAREAARKARDLTRRKSALDGVDAIFVTRDGEVSWTSGLDDFFSPAE